MLHQAISVHAYCSHSIFGHECKYRLLHLYTWRLIQKYAKEAWMLHPAISVHGHIVVTLYLAMNMSTSTLVKGD